MNKKLIGQIQNGLLNMKNNLASLVKESVTLTIKHHFQYIKLTKMKSLVLAHAGTLYG